MPISQTAAPLIIFQLLGLSYLKLGIGVSKCFNRWALILGSPALLQILIQSPNSQSFCMKALFRMLACLFLAILASVQCLHRCIHEEVIKDHKMVPINDSALHHRRLLQQTYGYGPMRMHLEYNSSTINSTDVVGRNIMKIMNIITEFWSHTLEIDYLPGLSFEIPPTFDPNKFTCMTFLVPRSLIDTPTPNKDFGLLIEAVDDGDSGVTAFSTPCAYSSTTKRPLWGFIHWNKNYLSFSPINFQQNIYIGIHEITHVLGFSQIMYSSYKNSQIYVTRPEGTYLNGPFLQAQLKRQYGCENPPGMPLETNGGPGTALSHWSRKTAANEYMTAGVSINNPTLSYITLALLEETGWYRRVFKNYGRFINFGFQKGCEMLDPNNCDSDEYCRVESIKGPDYDMTALGYCKNDSLSKCFYNKFYVNFICTDPNYAEKSLHADQGIINTTGEAGGHNSRCFSSDLRVAGVPATKYPFRCYETLCSPYNLTLTIRVGKTFAFCKFPNQIITVRGYDGTITCPDSFSKICSVKRCPKECNANGVCLGGRCLCDSNYQGELCDKISSTGFASQTNLFLSSENNNCLIGTYRNIFGDCELCTPGCAKCNQFECVLCLNQSLPVRGSCRV